jgi:hypothetical protein
MLSRPSMRGVKQSVKDGRESMAHRHLRLTLLPNPVNLEA